MAITGKTALYGLIGHPIEHVGSPILINAYMAETGWDGVLVPLHVKPSDLGKVVDGLRRLENLRGFLVTIPHKQTIVPLLDRLTESAELSGAVNVVRRDSDGTLTGDQLDGQGCAGALRKSGVSLAGARIYMSGAGGVAAGIGFALAQQGAGAITIFNRTISRAEELAHRIKSAFPSCETRVGNSNPRGHDIVVNATSLGLKANDPYPMDVDGLDPSMMAVDVVINPQETAFLTAAAARGCRVQHGFRMVEEQLPLIMRAMDPNS
ncbi:shikimate dehydrogenase [Microvirga sp. KLBC 81]|uniref:shikimate dehydrogenase family protein n=1 Tax=Microvirga sp. KLBC 81 TaxID=1862707 RepID=UPI000D51977F|nr:shikimate dehydrogenase [Microvirga sp. KLBC 81]PVE22295.1 shikimate dehydrogenase [Microvirga sp. KLBC 81]